MKIQSIRIDGLEYENVFCMFCGIQVINQEDEPHFQSCEHLLFLAVDEIGDYTYKSDLVAGILPTSDEDFDSDDDDYFQDRLTRVFEEEDKFPEDSFVIESQAGSPLPGLTWIGFSPT